MTARNKTSKFFPAFKDGLPSAVGKLFVITGTTSGTGFIAARTVVEKGGRLVCLNRPSQRVLESTDRLRTSAAPSARIWNIDCDLQDFASVTRAAQDIQSNFQQVYCLACNAGIEGQDNEATTDGCDVTMQTNHLSHFLLARELFPLLEAHAREHGDARFVTQSSQARNMTEHKGLEQKYFEKRGGDPALGDNGRGVLIGGGRSLRYAQSKLANSVMMHALHAKLQAKGSRVRAICCHPGLSVTNLTAKVSRDAPWLDRVVFNYILLPFASQSSEDGAMGLLHGMMGDDACSGALYGPTRRGHMAGPPAFTPPRDYETDPDAMQLLWKSSEESTGVTFEI